nr:WYL domain-containing protein [uncultured Shewanella sp.]
MSEHLKNTKVIWQGQTKTVEFSYVDFQGNKTRRKVDVSHVLFDADNNYLYLQGHCHLKNAERHFRVDKIETMLLIGSKRMYVEEWLCDLGIDDPHDCIEQQNLSSTQRFFQKPETKSEFNSPAKNPSLPPVKGGKGCLGIIVFALVFATAMYLSEDKLKLNNFISKLDTQLNSKPATVFTFGGDKENFCSVSINNDFFKSQNGAFSNARRNEPQFNMDCNTGGNYFVISSEHDTYANVKFYGRSETPKTIYANIDAKLTTPDGDSLFVSGSDIAVSLE